MAEDDKKPTEEVESKPAGTDESAANPNDEGLSLENEPEKEGGDPNVLDASNAAKEKDVEHVKVQKTLAQRVQHITRGLNIYLIIFIFLLVIAGIASFATYRASKKAEDGVSLNGQTLSDEELKNLSNNNTEVGDPKQTLTVASNAVFNGRVLVRDSLDVAGTLRVGGALSLPSGLSVAGTSSFENVQVANNISAGGNGAIQGTLTVQKNLTVGGSATFAGDISAPSLNIDRLILNKDIAINRHIDAGGGTPKVSSGSGIGGAGTVSISGSDTAGTVSLNFGTSPIAGILANITFAAPFTQTPHIVITPVGSSCANLNYYINRTTTGFSIGTTSNGAPGAACAFDFIAID